MNTAKYAIATAMRYHPKKVKSRRLRKLRNDLIAMIAVIGGATSTSYSLANFSLSSIGTYTAQGTTAAGTYQTGARSRTSRGWPPSC